SSSRPISEITRTPSMFLMPSRCLAPKAPAPASATLMVLLWLMSVFLQDQVAHRGVARGHMVEAVRHLGRGAASRVGHRAARDQPHHEFDAFAARFAHVVDVRDRGRSGGVLFEQI